MQPTTVGPGFPEQYLLGSPFLSYWYVGNASLTFPTVPADILGRWLVEAQTFKDYIQFRSPLELSTEKITELGNSEKEKAGIEDVLKSTNDKASVDNNDTNAAVKEEIKADDSPIISVKDLIDALSILLVSSKEVIIPNVKELIDVMDMQIDTPEN